MRAVREQFALEGEYRPLVSERDQNFHLHTTNGEQYVVKVTSAAERRIVSEFHLAMLLHLQTAGDGATPRVVRTAKGENAGHIEQAGQSFMLRVVSYLEGTPLSSVTLDQVLARGLGARLAALDIALQGFSHPGESPELLWDLQRVAELRHLLHHVDNDTVVNSVAKVIDDFERNVATASGSLRRQVIHGDANPENVLLDETRNTICGFIDFSDSVNAPLIFDVAIAASYLRSSEPLSLIGPFVAAYHAVLPLHQNELDLLFDTVRARLAITITILYWRLAEKAEQDAYRDKALLTEAGAVHFLSALDELGRDEFLTRLMKEPGIS